MKRHQLNASVLAWLRCFEAAARLGNFTRAAAELYLTQGAVSQQIRQLEDRLGYALFHRLGRRIVLTPEGEQLKQTVAIAFEEIEHTLSLLHRNRTEGPMYLSCYPSFALLWLMPRIGGFFRTHPEIDLRVSAEFHAVGQMNMMEEEIDAAVRYDLGQYSDLEVIPLLDEYLLPVASPAFVAAHPELKAPSDLTSPMLLHDANPWAGAEETIEWQTWLKAAGVPTHDFASGKRFNLSQLAISAALAGQGVAMGRSTAVLNDINEGRLVNLFDVAARSPAAYYLVYPPRPNARVQAFADWLRSECEQFARQRAPLLHLPSDNG
jgi:LysR family transcriptional regulator, glycine cleavage system transcriptional activator